MADNARITHVHLEAVVTDNTDPKVVITQSVVEAVVTDSINEKIIITQSIVEVIESFQKTGAASFVSTAAFLSAGAVDIGGQLALACTALMVGVGDGYVTTDSFTEAGDTALTDHTDDEGNPWSLTGFDVVNISGANDNVEVK